MLSGLSFFQIQLDQKVKYSMSWMVAHSFIRSLGLEDSQNIGRSVTCIVSMWQRITVLQLSPLMVKSKVPQKIRHTRGELEAKLRHPSHFLMIWNWPWRKTTSCLIQAQAILHQYTEQVSSKSRLQNTYLTGRCWSPNSSDSSGKCKGKHCSLGGRHWSPCFIVLLHRNERWRIIFSAWAKGIFNKTTCLEHESSEGEAWCMCNNIFFIHAILGCDTTSRLHGIGKGTSEKILWEPSLSQSSLSVQQHIRLKERSFWSWWESSGLPLQW